MRKFLKMFMLLLYGTLVLTGIAHGLSSCEGYRQDRLRHQQYVDSIEFITKVANALPQAQQQAYSFEGVIEIMQYKAARERQQQVDSIFLTLTDQQLANIASVVFKHKRRCTISEIVAEYQSYQHVYDGLPEEKNKSDTEQKEVTIDDPTPVEINLAKEDTL